MAPDLLFALTCPDGRTPDDTDSSSKTGGTKALIHQLPLPGRQTWVYGPWSNQGLWSLTPQQDRGIFDFALVFRSVGIAIQEVESCNTMYQGPEFFQKWHKQAKRLAIITPAEQNHEAIAALAARKRQLVLRRDALLSSVFYWFSRKIRRELFAIDQQLDEIEYEVRTMDGSIQRSEELRRALDESKLLLSAGRELLKKKSGDPSS